MDDYERLFARSGFRTEVVKQNYYYNYTAYAGFYRKLPILNKSRMKFFENKIVEFLLLYLPFRILSITKRNRIIHYFFVLKTKNHSALKINQATVIIFDKGKFFTQTVRLRRPRMGRLVHIATIAKKPITIYGDGKQVHCVLYINDLIGAFDAFLKRKNQLLGSFQPEMRPTKSARAMMVITF